MPLTNRNLLTQNLPTPTYSTPPINPNPQPAQQPGATNEPSLEQDVIQSYYGKRKPGETAMDYALKQIQEGIINWESNIIRTIVVKILFPALGIADKPLNPFEPGFKDYYHKQTDNPVFPTDTKEWDYEEMANYYKSSGNYIRRNNQILFNVGDSIYGGDKKEIKIPSGTVTREQLADLFSDNPLNNEGGRHTNEWQNAYKAILKVHSDNPK